MKPTDLLQALGDVDEALIAETAPGTRNDGTVVVKRPRRFMAIAIAATAIALGSIGLLNIGKNAHPPPVDTNLPMLTVTTQHAGGMGYEAFSAYDVSELTDANPWTPDAVLETLPVYRNTGADFWREPWISAEREERMRDILKEASKAFEMDHLPVQTFLNQDEEALTTQTGISEPHNSSRVSHFILEDDRGTLEVSRELITTYFLKVSEPLPDSYRFNYGATYDELLHTAHYFLKSKNTLMGLRHPVPEVSYGNYSYDGTSRHFQLRFFEDGDDVTEQILGYNFTSVAFFPAEDGNVWAGLRQNHYDLSEKMGDYPIITPEEAQTLLSEGHGITTVPRPMPGVDFIRKTELVYRNSPIDAFYMPYYRFYVEIPELAHDNGLKTFGAYYVPAVEGRYIENMPRWDDRFNN